MKVVISFICAVLLAVLSAAVPIRAPAAEAVPSFCTGQKYGSDACRFYRATVILYQDPKNVDMAARALVQANGLRPDQVGPMRRYVLRMNDRDWLAHIAGVMSREGVLKRGAWEMGAFTLSYMAQVAERGVRILPPADKKYYLGLIRSVLDSLPLSECAGYACGLQASGDAFDLALNSVLRGMNNAELECYVDFSIRKNRAGAGLDRYPAEQLSGLTMEDPWGYLVARAAEAAMRLPDHDRKGVLDVLQGKGKAGQAHACRASKLLFDTALSMQGAEGTAVRAYLVEKFGLIPPR